MNIVNIEPTPSPNTMKIVLDESLPKNESRNFNQSNVDQSPEYAKKLLAVEGVKGLYHVANFIALERNAKIDWKQILPHVRQVFGEQIGEVSNNTYEANENFGEVQVFIQMFKHIPMQIKLTSGEEEKRIGLPESFGEAALNAQLEDENIVMERTWKESGIRYGDLDEIGEQVLDEIVAAYPQERLSSLVNVVKQPENESPLEMMNTSSTELAEALKDSDWKVRYAALDKYEPSIEDIDLLVKALGDEKVSIRRLAVVYLGMLEDYQDEVLPHLIHALHDKAVTVRRTAGDCLSDLGNKAALPAMIAALKDKNKLVRWRAAMYIYEVGDESAVQALKEAQDDKEFEVALQVKMALARIEGGEVAKGSVWKQMTEVMKDR
jgi:hypothetical protein